MLVPLNVSQPPSRAGTDERTPTPGAVTSGFIWFDTGVGPAEENDAIRSGSAPRPVVEAATVIAFGVDPGELIEPRPNSLKSLPAATTGTTPASAAPFSARTTMSRASGTSGSPIERLTTSMPSRTAASIAAVISGALLSRPKSGVGIV